MIRTMPPTTSAASQVRSYRRSIARPGRRARAVAGAAGGIDRGSAEPDTVLPGGMDGLAMLPASYVGSAHPLTKPRLDRSWSRATQAALRNSGDGVGKSLNPDRRGDPPDSLGPHDAVDLDDLAVTDREADNCERPSAKRDDRSRGSIHQGWPNLCAGEGSGAGPAGDRSRAFEDPKRALCAEVFAQDDVWIEDRDKPIEVTATRRRKEGIDDRALTGQVRVRSGNVGTLDPTPGPAGELPRRLGRSIDHRRDLVERQLEHVVEDEGEPFSGGSACRARREGPARPSPRAAPVPQAEPRRTR